MAKTNIGRGPGEVINPFTFFIGKNGEILLWDQAFSTMLFYDINLNYIRNEKCDINIRAFREIKQDTFLTKAYKSTEVPSLSTSYCLYTDGFSNVLSYYLPVNRENNSWDVRKPISNSNQILLIEAWDYNIYRFVNSKTEVGYKIDFGKYMFTNDEMKKGAAEKWKKISTGEKVGSIFNLCETENFITFCVFFKGKIQSLVYSKLQKKVMKLKSLNTNETIADCIIYNVKNSKDNIFIGVMNEKNASENQNNPSLILFRLN